MLVFRLHPFPAKPHALIVECERDRDRWHETIVADAQGKLARERLPVGVTQDQARACVLQ